MLEWLLALLFPRQSVGGEAGAWITEREIRSIRCVPIREDALSLRARGVQYLDCLVAAATYDDSPMLRSALHRFKYRGVRSLSIPLGTLLADAVHALDISDQAILCPVPLHWTRRFARGFNQSALLAQEVVRVHRMQMSHMLFRRRPTGHQAQRTREQRISAMRNAFALSGPVPSHVILIDDVATTCSTLDACACALQQAGATRVDALVIALG